MSASALAPRTPAPPAHAHTPPHHTGIIDLFFILDILITFNLIDQDPKTGRWLYTRAKIRRKYLSTWFCIDLVSSASPIPPSSPLPYPASSCPLLYIFHRKGCASHLADGVVLAFPSPLACVRALHAYACVRACAYMMRPRRSPPNPHPVLPFWTVAFALNDGSTVCANATAEIILGDDADSSSNGGSAVRMLRLVRMIKLARILKASRVIKRFSNMLLNDLDFPRATLKLFTLTTVLLLTTHWIACLWSIVSLNLATPAADGLVPDTWVGAYIDNEMASYGRRVFPFDLYVSALYWSFMTLTSIGYGDFYPHNTVERAVSCFLQLISGMVWAYVIGTMASIAATINPNNVAFEATMDHLNRFMAERRLPKQLRSALREYFESARRVHRVGDDDQLIQDMSPMLQGAVATCTTGRWLRGIPFLGIMRDDNERDQGFITNLATRMKVAAFVKAERLPLGRLYMLRKGMAVKLWRLYLSGRAWGEDILLDDPELIDHAQAVTLTFTETFHLTRSDFEDASELFPEEYARVKRHIRLHLQLQRVLLRALAIESGKVPRSFVGRSVAKGFSYVEPEGPNLEQKVDKLLSCLGISATSDALGGGAPLPTADAGLGKGGSSGSGGEMVYGGVGSSTPPLDSARAAVDSFRMASLDSKLESVMSAVAEQRQQLASLMQYLQAANAAPRAPAWTSTLPSEAGASSTGKRTLDA